VEGRVTPSALPSFFKVLMEPHDKFDKEKRRKERLVAKQNPAVKITTEVVIADDVLLSKYKEKQ
jgi:hypothetical protein